jgi:hypothetical protein
VRKSEWRTCWNFPIRESKHLYPRHPDRPANAKIFTAPPFVGGDLEVSQNLLGVYWTYFMGMLLIGVHLMGMYLINVHLTGVYHIGVHLTGVYLIGVHLTGVYLIGVYLTGVHLMAVYVSKSKKALGKPSRSPTLQTVVDLLRSEL